MTSVRIKYLQRYIDRHGRERIYVRRKGRKNVPIKARLGSPEFWAEYQAAIAAAPEPAQDPAMAPEHSLRRLCSEYFKSANFKQLSDRSRYVRRRDLERFCKAPIGSDGKEAGSKPYKMLGARHIRRWLNTLTETPEAGNGVLKALRALFDWAVEDERLERNIARDVKFLQNRSDGFHTWTVPEIIQFCKHHPEGTKARLALSLLLFTGVRRSDAVRLGRQMVRDGWLYFTETKGRDLNAKERAIPIIPQLQAQIDACPSGHMTFLVTEFGKPFTSNGFGNWFKKRCREAGLAHCSAHGLRKAGATIAAEGGATAHELMAIFGWQDIKQAQRYTEKARRKRLAGNKMHLLAELHPDDEPENAGKTKLSNPGSENV